MISPRELVKGLLAVFLCLRHPPPPPRVRGSAESGCGGNRKEGGNKNGRGEEGGKERDTLIYENPTFEIGRPQTSDRS